MTKWTFALLMVMAFAVVAQADYAADRKAALDLVRKGQHQEALDAFLKIADATQDEAQKTDALEQAATAAGRLKQFDQAMEIARRIPNEPMSKVVQMRLLADNRKRDEVINQFKDESFDAWPDRVAGEAHFLRGISYQSRKDGAKAEADLKKATERMPTSYPRNQALVSLAQVYQDLLKDDDKALAAYREAQAQEKLRDGAGWLHYTTLVGMAGILRKQEKYDEALAVLGNVDAKGMGNSYWRAALLAATGEVYAAQGKKAEAIETLKDAASTEKIPASQKAAIEKRIQALEAQGN